MAVKNGTESQDVRLSLSFLDKTEQTVPLSLEDVQRVEMRGDLIHAVVPGKHGPERVLAFDRNPKELFVGDLVDCLYQNGLDRGRWFRGRIAMMNRSMKTCNIAYDDGEVSYLITALRLQSFLIVVLVRVRGAARTRKGVSCRERVRQP